MPQKANSTSFKKGHITWNKDKKTGPLSKEHRQKIKEALKKNPPSSIFKKGHKTWLEGIDSRKHPCWKGFRMTKHRVMGTWNTFKKILLKDIGKCELCGIDDRRVLQLHHKDGNEVNNLRENLQLLCANCHMIIHNEKGDD